MMITHFVKVDSPISAIYRDWRNWRNSLSNSGGFRRDLFEMFKITKGFDGVIKEKWFQWRTFNNQRTQI